MGGGGKHMQMMSNSCNPSSLIILNQNESKLCCCCCLSQADPDAPVLTAGDPERMNMKKCEEMGGIPYHINVVNYMVRAARNNRTK